MYQPKPSWLKVALPKKAEFNDTKSLIGDLKLVTVCEEAQCPNRWECWSQKTATFMLAGDKCTRACGFCAVKTCRPDPLDEGEPERVALAVKRLNLRHVVITSVTRDDLSDGGARHFAQTVEAMLCLSPDTVIELLIPDFNADVAALKTVINSSPHIIGHNLETVERLTPFVRSRASFKQSLSVLQLITSLSDGKIFSKSGLMLGLGEKRHEVLSALTDLRENGVSAITLGQYLQPTAKHLPVVEYIKPEMFEQYKTEALDMGFDFVASGPLVRSSYHAADFDPRSIVKKNNQLHIIANN